jgi:hypothetical protein
MAVEVGKSDYEPDAVLRCGDPLPGDVVSVPDPLAQGACCRIRIRNAICAVYAAVCH